MSLFGEHLAVERVSYNELDVLYSSVELLLKCD